ncbi:MAG: glycosyltransferase, partial [Candidatus Binatia bacterium]|nr:glycosyltransferase [Candidatus Binatia bacterium]
LVMHRADSKTDYPWEAKYKVDDTNLASFLGAADYINKSHANLVSLQHEFGLYGGNGGEYIVPLVESLKVPLVTTFHTVVADPDSNYGMVLRRIAARSEAIVVMMNQPADRLVKYYGVPRKKIVVIPHGVPDLPFNNSRASKSKRRLTDRLVLGNINLLSPGKGIEYALEAVAEISRQYPEVLYLVIGQTHPDLLKAEGEKYRNYLKRRVRELDIRNNVRFINEYLSLNDLIDWLKTIDIYVTPYLDPQQVTSGALAYAIGAGKACVSTSYIYATEVLADGRGVLVPFRDPGTIAKAVIGLQKNNTRRKDMQKKAYEYGRLMTWPNVAQSHLQLFRSVLHRHACQQPADIHEDNFVPSVQP